jgi:hypothetical protein
VDPGKRERRFLEAVRLSGLVPDAEIDRAVAFQKFAHARGKPLPLDRILLKFKLLDEPQIEKLYAALRYFLWRKEDKLYGKVAVKNQLLTEQDMKRCLKEQKRAFQDRRELRRVNEIAFEKGLMTPKEDRALIAKLKELKPKLTITPLQVGGPATESRGPAKKGEEEEWRRNMHARELEELQRASSVRDKPPRDEGSEKTVKFQDEEMPELTESDSPDDLEPVHLSADQGEDDDLGDPLSDAKGKPIATDDDLDPLWAEADLDDVELDSEQRDAAKNARDSSSSGADDETDLF